MTRDERNFTRKRRGSHEAAKNEEGQRLRCLTSFGARLSPFVDYIRLQSIATDDMRQTIRDRRTGLARLEATPRLHRPRFSAGGSAAATAYCLPPIAFLASQLFSRRRQPPIILLMRITKTDTYPF